jgi:hypothetical protein
MGGKLYVIYVLLHGKRLADCVGRRGYGIHRLGRCSKFRSHGHQCSSLCYTRRGMWVLARLYSFSFL